MDKITHDMRLAKWADIIREGRNNGMSIRAWCKENNVNEKQFYYWQRRIRVELAEHAIEKKTENKTEFTQLPILVDYSTNKSSFKADIVIHVGDNVLELSNTISENLLSMVVKVLTNVK